MSASLADRWLAKLSFLNDRIPFEEVSKPLLDDLAVANALLPLIENRCDDSAQPLAVLDVGCGALTIGTIDFLIFSIVLFIRIYLLDIPSSILKSAPFNNIVPCSPDFGG